MVHRVAVIGAGPSGLSSVKACLDEGLLPTCFESSDDLGGLWRFKEVSEPNRANIYRSLTINTSKEMICFSDFPIPADYPNYMHHSKILSYFKMYAEHFHLLQHIRFQTSVKTIKERPDFSRSGQWEVVTEGGGGQQEKHVFDAVICCSGHYTYPNLPLKDFPGELFQLLPANIMNWLGEKKVNAMYDHTMYALKPKHRLFSQIPVINDDLPFRILSGSVILKPNVKEIRASSVLFDDGSAVEDVDTIVFATGYNYDFPYMPSSAVYRSGHRVGLYKHIFPPNLEHPTLAVVGFIHALGAIMPQAEIQARWVARVFKGEAKFILHLQLTSNSGRVHSYIVSKLAPLHVDFVSYMDEVAAEVGARPSLLWLFFTDYQLFKRILWGPVSAYQYRLVGPGKWAGARRAIFTQFDRMFKPLKTRELEVEQASVSSRLMKLSLTAVAGAAAVYYVHVRDPTLLSKLRPQTA
ncbi:dimethylaniline monooxygenase [N-oxide-forming] 2-like [Pungitius pungitius]|uniref:dimethylaniline monooxygenase [N-oxide-forming] 2-like n=1 Tax=Pungitius pungitius TaxID=134920 RepID=UPI002E15F802